jgi:hypothetical protein
MGATLSILGIVKFLSPNNAMNAKGGTYFHVDRERVGRRQPHQ